MNKRKLICYQITQDNNNERTENREEGHSTEVSKLNYKILKLWGSLESVYYSNKNSNMNI